MLGLTEHFGGKNYQAFCDNFFTSPRLFRELYERGLYSEVEQARYPTHLKNVTLASGVGVF